MLNSNLIATECNMRRLKTTYEKALRSIWETKATASSSLLGGTTCRAESLVPTTLERAVFHTQRTYINTTATKFVFNRYLDIKLQGRGGSSVSHWPVIGF